MENKQAQMLIDLAKKLKSEKKDKVKVAATFTSAGILTKNGRFTKHYSNLEKAIVSSAALK